jgi:hypothetical protein
VTLFLSHAKPSFFPSPMLADSNTMGHIGTVCIRGLFGTGYEFLRVSRLESPFTECVVAVGKFLYRMCRLVNSVVIQACIL